MGATKPLYLDSQIRIQHSVIDHFLLVRKLPIGGEGARDIRPVAEILSPHIHHHYVPVFVQAVIGCPGVTVM